MDQFNVGETVKLITRCQLYLLKDGPPRSNASVHKGTKVVCVQSPKAGALEGQSDFVEEGRQFVCVRLPNEAETVGYVRANAVVRT